MRLILAKPSVAAFEGDIRSSKEALAYVRKEAGLPAQGEYKVNQELTLDFGLQLIVFDKHLGQLSDLEETIRRNTDGIPLSVHGPYNYDAQENWENTDLTQGSGGKSHDNLRKIAAFSQEIGALSVAVHPNAIRNMEDLKDPEKYNPGVQRRFIDAVTESISSVNREYGGIIDLENKPLPATTPDNENPIFTTVFHPFAHLLEYTSPGRRITFDTCHYGITRDTINKTLERFGRELTDEDLRREEMFGYFASDYVEQPSIADAMVELGSAINHIHLNDGSVYRPNPDTGYPDREKKLPMVGGYQLWWEAYVPGKGELCNYDCIVPWLREHQKDDRDVTLTLEVSEFNGDYDNSPRSREALKDAVSLIRERFG